MKQRRNVVHEPEVPDVDLDVQMWDELPDEKLAQSDELGWAPIHHAARKGVLHIIERAVLYNNQLLEQKTIDVAAITPLLIAVQVTSSLSTSSSSSLASASSASSPPSSTSPPPPYFVFPLFNCCCFFLIVIMYLATKYK